MKAIAARSWPTTSSSVLHGMQPARRQRTRRSAQPRTTPTHQRMAASGQAAGDIGTPSDRAIQAHDGIAQRSSRATHRRLRPTQQTRSCSIAPVSRGSSAGSGPQASTREPALASARHWEWTRPSTSAMGRLVTYRVTPGPLLSGLKRAGPSRARRKQGTPSLRLPMDCEAMHNSPACQPAGRRRNAAWHATC